LIVGGIALSAVAACSRDRAEPRAPTVTPADTAPPSDMNPARGDGDHHASIGRSATRAETRAWDIDVNPTGRGLPAGHGSYDTGALLFAQKCAACHGTRGEGLATYPRLIGREPRGGFPFGQDLQYVKTIGNYWPYATTLYDYINRAMPLTAPGSLSSDQVYSLVAFLLAENGITDRTATIDARSLPRVRMPAREHFVVDNRTGGRGFR
jgi:cytochrome c